MASSKKSSEKEVSVEPEIPEKESKVIEVPAPPQPKPALIRKPRGLSFTQWASLRGFKQQHLGGMRAFLKNPAQLRSAEDWDKVFETY